MTKKWNLWIDDIRNPKVFDQDGWRELEYVWATGVEQAKYFCELWGPPAFMALDHDLGYDPGVMRDRDVPEFLRWLADRYPDSPPQYSIHTGNPEGRKNMKAFMESWKKSLEEAI